MSFFILLIICVTVAISPLFSGMKRSTIHRILAGPKYHPFHINLHQALYGNDFQRRMDYCNWLQLQLEGLPDFASKIVFTDEATFYRDASVNIHNAHYWSVNNPHWLRETHHQARWSVNVWCGMVRDKTLRPVIIEGYLWGATYCQLSENEIANEIDGLPLAIRHGMWWQQDGASPHTSAIAVNRLNEMFPERWIGLGGTVPWPARSLDLSPLDFFLWGYLKDKVYETDPVSRDELKERITRACAEVPRLYLRTAVQSVDARGRLCIIAEGRQFEQYL